VVGIPYALGSRKALAIVARGGTKHVIQPSIDPAGNLHIAHSERDEDSWAGGTSVDVPVVPELVIDPALEHLVQDFHPQHWVRSFAAFNPHATLSYQAKGAGSEEAEIYKSTRKDIKKYVPSQPTSPHWYSSESLNVLVCSHIAHARNAAAATCRWEPSCASLQASRARKGEGRLLGFASGADASLGLRG